MQVFGKGLLRRLFKSRPKRRVEIGQKYRGKSVLGRGRYMCKGPEEKRRSVCSRNRTERKPECHEMRSDMSKGHGKHLDLPQRVSGKPLEV